MHMIVPSAEGGQMLLTPSGPEQNASNGDPFPDLLNMDDYNTGDSATSTGENKARKPDSAGLVGIADGPTRVTFDSTADSQSQQSDNTPTRMPTSPHGGVPPSSQGKHGHHGFTPMTLQQLMKLETPESRVDEMLQELYNLMGYYETEGPDNYASTASLYDLDPELSNGLFSSPLPDPMVASVSSAGGDGSSGDEVAAGDADGKPRVPAVLFGSDQSGDGAPAELPAVKQDTAEPAPSQPLDPLTARSAASLTPVAVQSNSSAVGMPKAAATTTADQGELWLERPRLRSSSVDVESDIADIVQMSAHRSGAVSPLDRSAMQAGWTDLSAESSTPPRQGELMISAHLGAHVVWPGVRFVYRIMKGVLRAISQLTSCVHLQG
jgi:hypothetical protein